MDLAKPVYLDSDKCNGCVSCMKRCPTEAIRVREGKATVLYERCVGCGECVKICRMHAKKETYDDLSEIDRFTYKIAVPSPSVYGQYNNLKDVNYLLTGLLKLGFDDVYESAAAAEEISAATRDYLTAGKGDRPLISSACPAVTKLITMRYEHLIPHLSPLLSPEALAVRRARERAQKVCGTLEGVGVFVITQCAACVTALKQEADEHRADGVLSFRQLYVPLLAQMNKLTDCLPLTQCGRLGISWGTTAGEAAGIGTDNFLCADGIENVVSVLEELEHEKLHGLDFLELYACTSGCVGGSMNVENPFLARTRLRKLRKATAPRYIQAAYGDYLRPVPYSADNVYRLDDNRVEAMKKMLAANRIYESLPKIDCGACGAPNCKAFAEDVVKGIKATCKYREGGVPHDDC